MKNKHFETKLLGRKNFCDKGCILGQKYLIQKMYEAKRDTDRKFMRINILYVLMSQKKKHI